MNEFVDIAERVLREDLEKGPFQNGFERGRWRLIAIEWPHALIAIAAAPFENDISEYALRFELTNYPASPPTAQPWDSEKNVPLPPDKRPRGNHRAAKAFRTDWKNGEALYLPCDRIAISDHDNWKSLHPSMLWSSQGDITQYLRIIYDLLN